MEKINYQKELENLLNSLPKGEKKPKLLLHACCGPCLTLPHKMLRDFFDITIIYNNSNIFPESEYSRRIEELKAFISRRNPEIKIIEFPYDNATYNLCLEPYADEPEGGKRCYACFQNRLSFGYQYAAEHGFDYFGTVMTISRYKNSQVINQIGLALQEKYPNVKWLAADFKKNDGYNKSLEIVREENMYFQQYCGCKYSYQKYQEKLQKNSEKNQKIEQKIEKIY